ncbi:hypothetical protein [Pararobbsia silviterrae]|nr:hypothetical protein [Pararobbsia silviterrae]
MPRLLSPHELATLLILLHSPAQVANTNPNLEALRAERLIEAVSMTAPSPSSEYRLTEQGNAVLRRLGVA